MTDRGNDKGVVSICHSATALDIDLKQMMQKPGVNLLFPGKINQPAIGSVKGAAGTLILQVEKVPNGY